VETLPRIINKFNRRPEMKTLYITAGKRLFRIVLGTRQIKGSE